MTVLQFGVGTTRALVKTTNAMSFTTDVAGTSGSTLNVNGHSVDQNRMDSTGSFRSACTTPRLRLSTSLASRHNSPLLTKKQYNWGNSVTALTIGGRSINIQC
ncbi:hypothetical protein DL89DRAFT_255442 [Linderina pennispora]|uniref:Uncharacterized protein n=1 Tax=Linderina pennispora TaxID=61395 RepID=A0A1Y1WIL5_9FUNG|nr:uncharacterized protein DL89DRAFT_255442 [Linderina pennispora]ORX73343.1 hypothetical protein DL89DRAFT_255442 [Linderina pennispora]